MINFYSNKFKLMSINKNMLKKVLIANRGEIAVRIIRACKELGITSVAIFAENDRDSLHISYADESYNLGDASLIDTYLNIDKIIEIAKRAKVDAIHAGYGFLAENANFAKAVEDNNLIFIGPSSEVIASMGDKLKAIKFMKNAGVPIIPSSEEAIESVEDIFKFADKYAYPIAIKAVAGGGGKGFKVVYNANEAEKLLRRAKMESRNYFGNDTVFIEKYLPNSRHIEVQIFGDNFGNIIHLGERNCSIQRRHQKLIEETPSPYLKQSERNEILEIALKGAKALNYRNAGTFEFLEKDGNFYFLEVNTRLQVEHTISEMVYGIDFVKEQISIASGNPLSYTQEQIIPKGHAIECRIAVEDVRKDFIPVMGCIREYFEPSGFGVRVDSVAKKNWSVPYEYDSMISKLIIWDENRDRCIKKANRALSEYIIDGLPTTIDFHKWVMNNSIFQDGSYDTSFISAYFKPESIPQKNYTLNTVNNEKEEKEELDIEIDGKLFKVLVTNKQDKKNNSVDNLPTYNQAPKINNNENKNIKTKGKIEDITAPMTSKISKVNIKQGDIVKEGDTLLVIEAMKMEMEIKTDNDAIIQKIKVQAGNSVFTGDSLVIIETV